MPVVVPVVVPVGKAGKYGFLGSFSPSLCRLHLATSRGQARLDHATPAYEGCQFTKETIWVTGY